MRKLIYHVAATVDGFIAREDGSFDCFPAEGDHIADYLTSLETYDTVLMGRSTYEVGFKLGVTNPYPSMKSYVFSRTMKRSPDDAVELVTEDPVHFVAGLKAEPGGDIYLCGGGVLAAQLLDAALIDEVIVKLNPLLVGGGIPIFQTLRQPTDLELIEVKKYESGVVRLSYRRKN